MCNDPIKIGIDILCRIGSLPAAYQVGAVDQETVFHVGYQIENMTNNFYSSIKQTWFAPGKEEEPPVVVANPVNGLISVTTIPPNFSINGSVIRV